MSEKKCYDCKYFEKKVFIDKGCGYRGGDFRTVILKCKLTNKYTESHKICDKYEERNEEK